MVKQGIAEGATCWQPEVLMPTRGCIQADVFEQCASDFDRGAAGDFWPGAAAMTFRTPREAVELANNTVYGLAASVWSESINVALHVSAQLKAGVVWVNSNESV